MSVRARMSWLIVQHTCFFDRVVRYSLWQETDSEKVIESHNKSKFDQVLDHVCVTDVSDVA